MVLKKTELCKRYHITTGTLDNYIKTLPPDIQKEFIINRKRYYNNKQLNLFKEYFGNWEQYSFKTKNQLCLEYEVSKPTFKKMLVECFGSDNTIVKSKSKLYTSKQVEEIYKLL